MYFINQSLGTHKKKTKREVKAKIIKKQHRVSKLSNLSEVIEKKTYSLIIRVLMVA